MRRGRHAYREGATDNAVVIGLAGRIHTSLQDLLRYLAGHRDLSEFLKPET